MTTTTNLTGDYVLDPATSRIAFMARHTMATKVPGNFEAFEGHAHLDADDPSRSTAHLTIQAASIQTHNPRRDKALRDEFLDATNHPTITFTATEVNQLDETTFALTGDLTIRGTTRPLTIPVALTDAEPDRLTFEGTIPINRRDWGAHWPAIGFLVSNRVQLELVVTAIRHP
jgi:polyisoprenoid-binding protein YceI